MQKPTLDHVRVTVTGGAGFLGTTRFEKGLVRTLARYRQQRRTRA